MAYNGVAVDHPTLTTTNLSASKLLNGDSGNDSLITHICSSQDTPPTTIDDLDVESLDGSQGGDVNSIFLCEFHATAGPQITLQVPNHVVTKELFRIVNQYIIPKVPDLQGSFLSISMFGKKILGYPIRLIGDYARNAYYFNLCFVFRPTTRTISYEPVVKKITEYLISLEQRERLLSQLNLPDKRERVRAILNRVRDDINRDKVCMLQEGCTTIPLCVVPHYQDKDTLSIGAHQAPVLIERFYNYKRDEWDLTTMRIVPFINGFNHIGRISASAHIALDLVRECIKHLVILEVALLVPVFQYNNMYRPTPKLSLLCKSSKMEARCIAKCSLSKQRKCSVRDVFRMFAAMAHGASFGEICIRFNPASLNINDRQMVLFGLVEGLIRIVNKYPISVNTNCFAPNNEEDDDDTCCQKTPSIFNSFDQDEIYPYSSLINSERSKPIPRSGQELTKQRNQVQILKKFYNDRKDKGGGGAGGSLFYTGLKTFDELSCAIGFSNQQLDGLLSRDKHCIVLFK